MDFLIQRHLQANNSQAFYCLHGLHRSLCFWLSVTAFPHHCDAYFFASHKLKDIIGGDAIGVVRVVVVVATADRGDVINVVSVVDVRRTEPPNWRPITAMHHSKKMLSNASINYCVLISSTC